MNGLANTYESVVLLFFDPQSNLEDSLVQVNDTSFSTIDIKGHILCSILIPLSSEDWDGGKLSGNFLILFLVLGLG